MSSRRPLTPNGVFAAYCCASNLRRSRAGPSGIVITFWSMVVSFSDLSLFCARLLGKRVRHWSAEKASSSSECVGGSSVTDAPAFLAKKAMTLLICECSSYLVFDTVLQAMV